MPIQFTQQHLVQQTSGRRQRRRFVLHGTLLLVAAVALPELFSGATAQAQEPEGRKAQAERQDPPPVIPIAVLPFQERGQDVEELGGKVTDLVFANLVTNPQIYLVEREDLDALTQELELNTSGLVNPAKATRIGQLTGARVLITGSVLQVGDKLYIVAKIVGTETSRVLGQSVKGSWNDELDTLVAELSQGVSQTVFKRHAELLPEALDRIDRIARLKKTLGGARRPKVVIEIRERHLAETVPDPAAETELMRYCQEVGFEVLKAGPTGRAAADVLLTGEGFSEFAGRHGDLVSVKARLEIKALDPESNRVLAVDREVAVGVGLAEQIAAKSALEEAAARIAERLLPRLCDDKQDKRRRPRRRR